MQHDLLKDTLADIESGNVVEARMALRPFLTGGHDAPSHEVRYVLGRAWFEEDKATARYLFEEALTIQPNFTPAGQYEARCGSALEDLESFNDARHPACETCGLRYRDHEALCPYCDSAVAPPRDQSDGSIEDQLRNAGQDVVDTLRTFSEREDVKQAKEKVVHAGQHAYDKAKELAESEKARELREKAEQLGQRTAAKAKAFSERDDVKDAVGKVQKSSTLFFSRLQDYLTAEQKRINEAQGSEKVKLIAKWVGIMLLILFLLRWIF